jgi:hypothetical protein
MNKTFLYSLLIPIALLTKSCKEENPLLDALEASTFECEERITDYYFEGTLNGERVCYHVGYDDYEMALRRTVGFTSGPLADPNNPGSTGRVWATFSMEPNLNTWKHLSQFFQIETPKFTNTDIGKDSILRATIKVGDLPLANEEKSDSVFNLQIVIFSKTGFENIEGGQTISLQTRGGIQKNSSFKVTELEISEVGSKRFYTITFEFACDLYAFGDGKRKYGRLEDGKLRIKVEVDK